MTTIDSGGVVGGHAQRLSNAENKTCCRVVEATARRQTVGG